MQIGYSLGGNEAIRELYPSQYSKQISTIGHNEIPKIITPSEVGPETGGRR